MTCATHSRTPGSAPPVVSVSVRFPCLQVQRKLRANRFSLEIHLTSNTEARTAPITSGWSDSCRAGFAPAEKQRLSTAHEKVGLGPDRPSGSRHWQQWSSQLHRITAQEQEVAGGP